MKTIYIVLFSILVSGCIAQAGGTDSTEKAATTTSQCIIGGDEVSVDNIGTPIAYNPSYGSNAFCSTAQINDVFLLTAHHCVSDNGPGPGGNPDPVSEVVVRPFQQGGQVAVKKIFLHPTLDVAILQLVSPLLGPNGEHRSTPFYSGTSDSLIGTSVYCQGWGANAINELPDGALGWQPGGGILRSAYIPVIGVMNSGYLLGPNSCGQIPWMGDSGSSCFAIVDGKPFIAGVMSWTWWDNNGDAAVVTQDYQIGADYIRGWVEDTIALSDIHNQ